MARSASSPDLHRGRCASAGRLRPSPTRVPIAALHWSPGGRCPQALQGRCFTGGSCQGFGRLADAGRLGLESRRIARSSRALRATEWGVRNGRVPSSPIPGSRADLANLSVSPQLTGLAISGSRPASASSKPRRDSLHRSGPLPLESCQRVLIDDFPALPSWLSLGGAVEELEQEDDQARLRVSLASSISGEMLGTVTLHSENEAQALQAVLQSVHNGGHCVRSTVEFWDGNVAGSAEGVLQIKKMGESSYKISHNFLELNHMDAGAALSFEDAAEMRIVVEGPSSRALIRIEPTNRD